MKQWLKPQLTSPRLAWSHELPPGRTGPRLAIQRTPKRVAALLGAEPLSPGEFLPGD